MQHYNVSNHEPLIHSLTACICITWSLVMSQLPQFTFPLPLLSCLQLPFHPTFKGMWQYIRAILLLTKERTEQYGPKNAVSVFQSKLVLILPNACCYVNFLYPQSSILLSWRWTDGSSIPDVQGTLLDLDQLYRWIQPRLLLHIITAGNFLREIASSK